MKMDDKTAAEAVEESTSWMEGGLMYPTGYIVVGLPTRDDALKIQQALFSAGAAHDDCVLVPAAQMAKAAAEEIESGGVMASLGSSEQVRQKQLQLAKEGCDFLIIKAGSDDEKTRAMQHLQNTPVRYAVHYRRLVIEDLIPHLRSATTDAEPARKR